MYGLINKAMGDLVASTHGEEKWAAILRRAGVETDVFVSDESYPDEDSYRLVAAAAQELQSSVSDFLMTFGEHWVLRTGLDHYGPLLHSGGRTLQEFLLRLPHFHTRVQLIYPNLSPPDFSCSHVEAQSLRLHYYSDRPGLKDFVLGLLQGLGKLYSTPVTITVLQSRDEGADHEVFEVNWAAKAP